MNEEAIKIMVVGQRAMELWDANQATINAKRVYYGAIKAYENKLGGDRISVLHADGFYFVKEATSTEYAAYQAAKRAAYNVKRRMSTACKRADTASKSAVTMTGAQYLAQLALGAA